MKLFYSKFSPFARKVLITAHITGHIKNIEIVDFMKSGSFKPSEDYHKSNPLLKIPALQITPDNTIIDSPIICEYLNSISHKDKIYPTDQAHYFFQRKIESIADGATDATVLRRYESLRPTNLFSIDYDKSQKLKIENSLNYLESITDQLTNLHYIGELSVMCLLSYLDMRFPHEDWRISRPKLSNWYDECQNWEPFRATVIG
jgi:glutathione S-transferase